MAKPRFIKQVGTGLVLAKDTLLGELQYRLGLPICHAGTPRLALEEWLQQLVHPPPVKARFLVTAMRNRFWILTQVYIACVLRSLGYASTLVFRGSQARNILESSGPYARFWRAAGRIPDLERVDLEMLHADPARIALLSPLAREWAETTVAYDEHREEADIRELSSHYASKVKSREESSACLAAALDGFLERRKFDRFICQSGLIEETPLLLEVARRHQLCSVCLESWPWRPGHLIFNINAPALDYDARLWMEACQPWDAKKEGEIRQYLDLVDGGCQGGAEWLSNFPQIQPAPVTAKLPQFLTSFLLGPEPVFLAPLNVVGDTSMLRRETIFASQQVWIRRILAFFARRPGFKLVIRAHPAEHQAAEKVRLRMAEFSKGQAGGLSNVRVISPEDRVNTFALLPFARTGLVWISSAGAEIVARGTPVVAAARPRYSGLGIVSEPVTETDYWAELERLAASPSPPSPFQREMALRYLYIIFKGFSYEVTGHRAGNGITTGWLMKNQRYLSDQVRFFQFITGQSPLPWEKPFMS